MFKKKNMFFCLVNGLLKGCIIDTYAPLCSFVLQSQNDTVGFYRVNNENELIIPSYHAYLNIINPNQSHYRIDKTIGSIPNQAIVPAHKSVYNNWGLKINSLSTGINIVQQPDGSYRIIFIK